MRLRRTIEHWEPEDEAFWEASGKRIAGRNLIYSIFVEHLGFTVWLLWSMVVLYLPAAGFDLTVDQLFWLVAVPNLCGATMRLPYTFAVALFGGRNWTVVSALLLLIPTGLLAWSVSDPSTPYWLLLTAAATAGFGGGNFASSMANISYFYPERSKGTALGVNAAGGNLGVAVVQLLVPVVVTIGAGTVAANAGLVWMPLILLSAVLAFFLMDNLTVVKADFVSQGRAFTRAHTWVMSFLYIGTFGSFIGFSAAFPLVINKTFPESKASYFAFLGALVGSLARPAGGWLADRLGGARVTGWSFGVMALGVCGAVAGLDRHLFWLFLGSFLLLFVASGAGNGSTYRMIPAIFATRAKRELSEGVDPAAALTRAKREAAAAIGIASSIGAFGGFLVPRGFAMSLNGTGSIATAMYVFLGAYGVFAIANWWFYLRRRVLVAVVPSLAASRV